MGKQLPRRERLLETNRLRNTVSRDTETENCKYLKDQPFAYELTNRFRESAFRKNSNRTLGGGDLTKVLSKLNSVALVRNERLPHIGDVSTNF
jgi:hypothetical protein